jgi:excisionase family DNA binding protein
MNENIAIAISLSDLDGLIDAVVEGVTKALDARDAAEGGWPAFMSVETAARYLDVSVERVRKLKERQEIPYIQEAPGCRVLFARRDLDAWMGDLRHAKRGVND